MENEKKNNPLTWLLLVLLGSAGVLIGIMMAFFPGMLIRAGLIAIAVIVIILGATDIIAAIKYKDDSSSWKFSLIAGLVNIACGIFLISAYLSQTVAGIVIYGILCLWAFVRGTLLVISSLIGDPKRYKETVTAGIEALLGAGLYFLRNIIFASVKIIGLVLTCLGGAALIAGFFLKSVRQENKGKQPEPIHKNKNDKSGKIDTVQDDRTSDMHGKADETADEEEKLIAEVIEEETAVTDTPEDAEVKNNSPAIEEVEGGISEDEESPENSADADEHEKGEALSEE